ncbi:uncharacterized protein YukE [Hamadaea flava]|uniref:DUF4157 domain-containing protein n=1 Tax=Hamadaea flava TaxID=1742688 RepID=A0ABV8LJK0_9ACTN|nr:DUF4157 domain-containing protein [Hamadaea flava]MCP2323596.1 uncharacterized protein YukE [Hamadaea flava]
MTINPLVAGSLEQPTSAWSGIWIAEDIELIAQGVKNGSWIDGTLGVVGVGLDGLALVSDPIGALLQYGISWLIEHVKPLTEALDWLAGDPGQIAGHAQTWRNIAKSLQGDAEDLRAEASRTVATWRGPAGDAYRGWARQQHDAILGIAKSADAMASITEGAGALIAAVRILVRDAIATAVSRLVVYAAELIASWGAATPLVVEQVTTLVASWAAKIARWLKALIASLRRLGPIVGRLAELTTELKKILGRLHTHTPTARAGENYFSKAPALSNAEVLARGPGTPMTLDNIKAIAQRIGVDLDNIKIKIIDDPEELRYLDFMDACAYTPSELAGTEVRFGPASFVDEETLAATIAHEYQHVAQQQAGEHLVRNLKELEDEAYAVESSALELLRRILS